MAANVLPYNGPIEHMSLGCIASSTLSTVVLADVLTTFAIFRNRVDCCFNRFIIIFCALQLLQCLQKITFSAFTILNRGLPFLACDINASLDQFFDFTSLCFLIAFFVGMSNARRYWESGWNKVAYICAPLLGFLSLATLWALLADRVAGVTYDSAPYFTQNLAWCWIPNQADAELAIIHSPTALRTVQFIFGYLPTVVVIISAAYAYIVQRCRTGESWLGKGVILRRFLGVSIFPVVIYVVGLPIRISFAANANIIAIVISTLYPLTGGIIGVVFLWTEGAMTWVPKLLWRRLTCKGGRGSGRVVDERDFAEGRPPHAAPGFQQPLPGESDALRSPSDDGGDRRFSDLMSPPRRSTLADNSSIAPSSPRRSGLSGIQDSWLHSEEAVPTSFTATLRTMMCDAVVGQHVASSRPAYYSAHYGRIISDRHSVVDSVATTESNFDRAVVGNGHNYVGEEYPTYQIYVDPSSRRSVMRGDDHRNGSRAGGGLGGELLLSDDRRRDSSLQELKTQIRLSDGSPSTPSTRNTGAQYTTRSERSAQYAAPQIRVRESVETPSSTMLMAYSNRSSAQRLQSSSHLHDNSATFSETHDNGVQRVVVNVGPQDDVVAEDEDMHAGME